MHPPTPSKLEQLQGTVQHLTFFNPENGYFVARVTVGGRGERTVTGSTAVINVGEQLSAKGVWTSSTWGPQFKASEVTMAAPQGEAAVEKYLATSIEGIGKGYAKKLVAAFGEAVFDVIDNTPEKLAAVKGIGPKRAASIIAAYVDQRAVRDIMLFLSKCGLSVNRAKKVYEKYGAKAVESIKENPYILCRDIWGIGFSTADGVALKQGIPADSEYRIRAGIEHVLREAESRGSCGLPVDQLRDQASELLTLDYDAINQCIDFELQAQSLIKDLSGDEPCLFLPNVYFNEKLVAKKLLEHARRIPVHTIDRLEQRISDAEVEIGMELEEAQREAVRVALSSSVCVLTGGPGTGKTTITRVILLVMLDAGITDVLIAAPTGKAAKRASEATGHPARTLHRTLEIDRDGQFKFNEKNPLEADALLVDEFSMVDVSMMASVVKALPNSTRFLMIGDVDQLPSVGAGKVLADIIDSGAIPTVRLKAVFRQGAGSQIIKNAHAINSGQMPDVGWREGADFCFTQMAPKQPAGEEEKTQCREAIEAEILRLARDMYKLGYDPIREVQVLAPMRRGILGVESLNYRLQAVLNPHPGATLEVFGAKWGTGDKVMQIKNNYEKVVFNGDIGYIVKADSSSRSLVVAFEGVEVAYKTTELEELRLAYAFTIHKSQGSEFPVVIMPIDWSHWTMLKRNLLYTGVTRSRKLCVLVGQQAAVKKAVESVQSEERYTRLKEWLQAGLPAEMKRLS